MAEGYSTNLGLGPLPEFNQADSPAIFADGVLIPFPHPVSWRRRARALDF